MINNQNTRPKFMNSKMHANKEPDFKAPHGAELHQVCIHHMQNCGAKRTHNVFKIMEFSVSRYQGEPQSWKRKKPLETRQCNLKKSKC
jgi:hypothetical protein